MQTVFIEVEHPLNWGKFLVGRFDEEEWSRRSSIPGADKWSILGQRGWSPRHVWVMDLETCEGAAFLPGGLPSADLKKHQVWVCPMFEPFLTWLYHQDLTDLTKLPRLVQLTDKDAEGSMAGYRRPGPTEEEREELVKRTSKKKSRKKRQPPKTDV